MYYPSNVELRGIVAESVKLRATWASYRGTSLGLDAPLPT